MNLLMTADEIKAAIGPERVANLEKLADYLESGELRAEFDMSRFTNKPNNTYECGSAGCAVGHGPYAGISKLANEDWFEYSERAFTPQLDKADSLWKWWFSMGWADTDNTPEGGAARIRWALKHGLPADWLEQIWGDAPLCYRSKSCQT